MTTVGLQPTDELHFQQLFDDYQRVARRSVLSGLHVHVEVPTGQDRVRIMNEVLPWLPMLLALSASSPFWNGGYSGFSSYRQVACDEWPRMGVPEWQASVRRKLATLESRNTSLPAMSADPFADLRQRSLTLPVQGIERDDLRDTFNEMRGGMPKPQADGTY